MAKALWGGANVSKAAWLSNCPVCSEHASYKELCPVTFEYGSAHRLIECEVCQSSFFHPVPTLESLRIFYSSGGYDFNPVSQFSRARSISKHFLLGRELGVFLDVGCATGFFLKGIESYSRWEVHGVELSEKAAGFARESLGLRHVLSSDLHGASYDTAMFDAVHISEVLEHVPNPLGLLRECRRVVKDDGIFFLSLPNGLADRQGLIDYNRKYQRPAGHESGHIYFFSSKGLVALLRRAGFKLIRAESYAFKQGLRSLSLFPKRPNWDRFYSPRVQPEVENSTEISMPHTGNRIFRAEIRYRFRERLALPGLLRAGLGWRLVLAPV